MRLNRIGSVIMIVQRSTFNVQCICSPNKCCELAAWNSNTIQNIISASGHRCIRISSTLDTEWTAGLPEPQALTEGPALSGYGPAGQSSGAVPVLRIVRPLAPLSQDTRRKARHICTEIEIGIRDRDRAGERGDSSQEPHIEHTHLFGVEAQRRRGSERGGGGVRCIGSR